VRSKAVLRRRGRQQGAASTIFFATDVHGSETCFRKFVNAYLVYQADVLILGGDMTGKLAVPIVPTGRRGRFSVFAPGGAWETDEAELPHTDAMLRRSGFYPFRADPDEISEFKADPKLVEGKLSQLMNERIVSWAEWADRKLADDPVEILVAPGNDDPWSIDPVLQEVPRFRVVEGEVLRIGDKQQFELASTGYANRTPWDTPRELDESELKDLLTSLLARVERVDRAILSVHVPPYNTGLDEAPVLHRDGDMQKVEVGMGQDSYAPVGSHAVREIIEETQPMLSLHGHIHESRGIAHLGSTIAINPGSEYGDGILRGALVRLGEDGVLNHQLTSG
jgi:Icc-related predicted phosphoesterase